MIIQEDEYICHYGVLGMKWGVRKAAKKVGVAAKKVGAAAKKAGEVTSAAIKKYRYNRALKSKKAIRGYKHLSDEELKNVISRLEQEKKYKGLVSDLNKKQEKSKSVVGDILSNFGKNTVNVVSSAASKKLGEAITKSLFGKEDGSDINYLTDWEIRKASSEDLKKYNARRGLEEKAIAYRTKKKDREDQNRGNDVSH